MQVKQKHSAIILLLITFVFLMYALESYPERAIFIFIAMAIIVVALAIIKWFK